MIQVFRNEFREDDLAVRTYKVVFFGFTIYRARYTSTNSQAVRQLTSINENKKIDIKGFSNENSNTNRESK